MDQPEPVHVTPGTAIQRGLTTSVDFYILAPVHCVKKVTKYQLKFLKIVTKAITKLFV